MTFKVSDLPYNQQGSYIYGDYTPLWFAQLYLVSIVGFSCLFKLWSKLLDGVIEHKRYKEFSYSEQSYYLATIVATTHHVIIVSYTYYIFLNPDCPDAFPMAFFLDDVCFFLVDPRFANAAFITSGYMTYDFFIHRYWVQDTSPLGKQTQMHHVIGVGGILFGIQGGFGLPGISCIALAIELSTIFLNLRSLYDKKDFGKPFP